MQDLTRSQKARVAIQSFKTMVNVLALRGFYRPSGRMGQKLAEYLSTLSPEIYGSMNDPRVAELKGLEYVIDRLPRGIEACTRIILTEEEQYEGSAFEKIIPLKRRRTCYRISPTEYCFVITRGMTEIYDIITHVTFLNIEAKKIQKHMQDEAGNPTPEWNDLEKIVLQKAPIDSRELERALWNLSLILGRSYQETRASYDYFEKNRATHGSNNGLFSLIYHLGRRVDGETRSPDNFLIVYMTPSLMNIIAHQRYGKRWAADIKANLKDLGLDKRPLHIISANMHSVLNLLYGFAATTCTTMKADPENPLYDFIGCIRDQRDVVLAYARQHGFCEFSDRSGSHIDYQIIDTEQMETLPFHPDTRIVPGRTAGQKPVILVMDYAFGAQAFEVMDCLLNPYEEEPVSPTDRPSAAMMNVASISIMGKAGILPGKKGDIMLATAHVMEGSSDNYPIKNDLVREDFDTDIDVYTGPIITVFGTSLQNRDLLQRFQDTWKTVGLEMEGAYYQRAISAALIKGHIPADVKLRYAYYASDNPLISGQTLAAGEMGPEGIRPTYMVTKVILEKIFSG
jgi:predicted RNA binding protein YcfA (HicA-like mRNA interferase family)